MWDHWSVQKTWQLNLPPTSMETRDVICLCLFVLFISVKQEKMVVQIWKCHQSLLWSGWSFAFEWTIPLNENTNPLTGRFLLQYWQSDWLILCTSCLLLSFGTSSICYENKYKLIKLMTKHLVKFILSHWFCLVRVFFLKWSLMYYFYFCSTVIFVIYLLNQPFFRIQNQHHVTCQSNELSFLQKS